MTLKEFFNTQVSQWPLAQQNYAALEKVETRDIEGDDGAFARLQFNPARVVSTKANIDPKALAKRPCFFCHENRPKEQYSCPELIPEQWRDTFELLVNPYPILPMHFTLPIIGHKPQRLKPYIEFMFDFVDMHPEMCCFYNGPLSGASAPDHMHFQSVPASMVPAFSGRMIPANCANYKGKREDCLQLFHVYHTFSPKPCGEEEPMTNVFVVKDVDGEYLILIYLRNQHRPKCYPDGRLVSPGALDMAGLMITPRREDFDTLTIEEVKQIYEDVASEDYRLWSKYIFDYFQKHGSYERFLRIGLVSDADREESYYINVEEMEQDGYRRYELHNDTLFIPNCLDATFAVRNMPIGINFHWSQSRDLRFRGALQIMREKDGTKHYVNILPLEEYLKSVISSEMSAMSNIELLKAHAIISRSWALAQLKDFRVSKDFKDTKDFKDSKDSKDLKAPNDLTSSTPHALFDLCADDHCQRYQGVTMQTSPLAEEAVEATRGKVLKYQDPADDPGAESRICDTRYSKCCGGKTEEFEYCWEDKHYDYLESVDCPYCNTREQFPNEEEERRVLSQVLNDYDLETKDFYEWVATVPAGKYREIVPLKRGKSGRIYEIKLVAADGEEKIIGKELAIRKALSDTHLYSSNFSVEKISATELPGTMASVPNASVAGSPAFRLKGKGWGHGVGLCQIGAAVMAEKGFKYDEILKHYFPKANIE